jgi:hypothetical protein
MSLIVVAGFAASEMENVALFDSYSQAYRTAQQTDRPLLVVLNPGEDSGKDAVSLGDITGTEQSRELLKNYVVTIIDADSENGQAAKKLFKAETLPHVVVIDKEQKYQLYKVSHKLESKAWTAVLRKYKNGEAPEPASTVSYRSNFGGYGGYNYSPARSYCPNCR